MNRMDCMAYAVDKKTLATPHALKYVVYRFIQAHHKAKLLQRFTSLHKKKLLDFGAGSGAFCGYLAENFPQLSVDLYDPSKPSLIRAAQLFGFSKNQIFDNPSQLKDEYYDIITSLYVYAYVPNKKQYWETLSSKLRRGGLLFVEVNGQQSLYCAFMRERIDTSWAIDFSKVPSDLELVGVYSNPYPSYLLNTWENPNPVIYTGKVVLAWLEKILRRPYQAIYVFKKR